MQCFLDRAASLLTLPSIAGNGRTGQDSCTAGTCAGVDLCASVTCSSPSECSVATCNVNSGECDLIPEPNNTLCSTGICLDSACVATTSPCNISSCAAATEPCQVATCRNGQCGLGNSSDSAPCTSSGGGLGACLAGVCVLPADKCFGVTCLAPTQCDESNLCDRSTGECAVAHKRRGTACNDDDVR